MNENVTKKKNSKVVNGLLICLVLAILVIGGTLAYLSSVTETKNNAFTFVDGTDGLSVELTETDWTEGTSGKDLAPGAVVKKNPVLTNNSTAANMDEWVALEVTFTKGDGQTALTSEEYTQLMGMITFKNGTNGAANGINTTNWTLDGTAGPVSVYFYNNKLAKDTSTEALFTQVVINSDLTNDEIKTLNEWNGFQIQVQGAALQGSAYDTVDAAKAELKGLFK